MLDTKDVYSLHLTFKASLLTGLEIRLGFYNKYTIRLEKCKGEFLECNFLEAKLVTAEKLLFCHSDCVATPILSF